MSTGPKFCSFYYSVEGYSPRNCAILAQAAGAAIRRPLRPVLRFFALKHCIRSVPMAHLTFIFCLHRLCLTLLPAQLLCPTSRPTWPTRRFRIPLVRPVPVFAIKRLESTIFKLKYSFLDTLSYIIPHFDLQLSSRSLSRRIPRLALSPGPPHPGLCPPISLFAFTPSLPT